MAPKFDLAKCQASIRERASRIEERLQRLGRPIAKKPLIFLGPSLDAQKARTILDAEYRQPICRDDLVRAFGEGYRVFGIIDGAFHQNLSVSIEEIRGTLEKGAVIYGSSSMGALRAAESYLLGMQGIGTIYRWYREEVIDSDDEVAVTFEKDSGKCLTQPSVNLRATLSSLEKAGKLRPNESASILEKYLSLHFTQRNLPNLFQSMAEDFSEDRLATAKSSLQEEWIDLKALDAIELLKFIRQKHFECVG